MNTATAQRLLRYLSAALALCLALAAVLLPIPASAQAMNKTVRVGWYDSLFNRMDVFGRRSGYAYEYQQKIAAYAGWSYEYVKGSWPELMQMLIDGEIDLLSDVSYTPERAEQMLFPSLPMGAEEYYLFVEPTITGYAPGDYGYFSGKRVGVNKGSVQAGFFENWLKSYDIKAEIVELTCTVAEAFEMLKRGELDGYVSLDGYSSTGTAVPEIRIGSSDFFFAVNRERSDLLNDLDVALNQVQRENRYYNQQLSQKYVSATGANRFIGAEEKAWLEAHGAIRVGYQDNCLALCAQSGNTGALTGALSDYLSSASGCLANANLVFEPVAYPSAGAAMKALQSGEVDCVFPSNLSISDGEAQGMAMTPPVTRAEIYALVRSAEQEAFAQKTAVMVAVPEDDPNAEAVRMDFFPRWRKAYYPDVEACMKAVKGGKADCLLISSFQHNNLSRLCKRYDLASLNTGKEASFTFAVSQGSRELYSILTRTTSIVSESTINAALIHYSVEDAKPSLVELIRDNLGIVMGVLIILAAMALLLISQRRMILAQRKIDEGQHILESLDKQVYVDALTHVRNKGDFEKYLQQVQEKINRHEEEEVAIGVFDCNDLKTINDQHGHEKGDIYLKTACEVICHTFQHSPVFRIGGDEFTVILMGEDFKNRTALIRQFEEAQARHSAAAMNRWEFVSVAMGVVEYDAKLDNSLSDTFRRADKLMYENKRVLKSGRGRENG